jgi:hypothetical protein
MKRQMLRAGLVLFPIVVAGVSFAQYRDWDRGRGRGRGWDFDDRGVISARDILNDPRFPTWEVDPEFKEDVFTFVRVRYSSGYSRSGRRGRRGGGGGWATDFPDSDMNFSLRLQQLTTLKVNPDPVVLDITDPRLVDYPFIYMIEPGRLSFDEAEVKALRRYLDNGGFMMVDDFWGDDEWLNFYYEIKRVFPEQNREPEEVPLTHKIFHCVYDMKEKPQVPSIHSEWMYGITYEPRYGSDMKPHYKAIKDDAGRIMVFICHNTDLGDGWEREGVDERYFEEFSVKKSYPMGINIVTYAMTH